MGGREWKDGSNSSYNCTPFLHSLLTKGKNGPDPREDPKSRSLKGVPIKYPLVARVPN